VKHEPKNVVASIQARLVQRSHELDVEHQLTLARFGGERLLYRLSRSEFSDGFILKGAALLLLSHHRRPERVRRTSRHPRTAHPRQRHASREQILADYRISKLTTSSQPCNSPPRKATTPCYGSLIHFLVDAQLPPALATWLISQGHGAS
jgi:hypothetical protein